MRTDEYLDLMMLPKFNLATFRYFQPHEHHINRRISDDVILLVLNGVLRFEEDGEEIDVHKGEWYIQQAGCKQTGLRESDSPSYFYIHCFATYTFARHNSLSLRGTFNLETLLPLLNALNQCSDKGHGMLERYIYFYRILMQLSDAEKNVFTNTGICSEIVAFIDMHHTEPFSLSEVVSRFSYSKDHIIRIFKKFYGITPYQYLISRRVNHAKELMLTGGYQMTKIAQLCGFGDMTSFYRAFKRHTGQAPSDWLAHRNREIALERAAIKAADSYHELPLHEPPLPPLP